MNSARFQSNWKIKSKLEFILEFIKSYDLKFSDFSVVEFIFLLKSIPS